MRIMLPAKRPPIVDWFLSPLHARLLLANGHFIAAPDEMIGTPGIDVDDWEHQIAQNENQRHAPGHVPL